MKKENENSREPWFSYNKSHFRMTAFCAGGPGGQHQNKVATAVRLVHKATGLSAQCTTYKSQEQNKKVAFNKLCEKLVQYHTQLEAEKHEEVTPTDRRVRTYNECTNRITDHDTGDRYSYKDVMGSTNKFSEVVNARSKKLSS